MALYGILGGIHGNLEALNAALAAFDARAVRKILCVGDVVGYNADPDECGELLRARKAIVIAGHHDLIATGMLGFERCSNSDRHALSRTRRALRADTAAWLRALPANRLVDDSIALAYGQIRLPDARLCFFRNSQEQKVYDATGEVHELPLGAALAKERVYFVNAGSVDAQKRHGPRFAECAIFDSSAWSVEFLKLRYDAASTEAKAAVGGYRIVPAMDALYTMQRRAARLPQIAQELSRAVQAFSAELVRRRLQPR